MVCRDPINVSTLKHVQRRHYYAREMQDDGAVSVVWIDTKFNVADALTKALKTTRFEELTAQMRCLRVANGKALSAARAALAAHAQVLEE